MMVFRQQEVTGRCSAGGCLINKVIGLKGSREEVCEMYRQAETHLSFDRARQVFVYQSG
jgi:hypothetical protein